MKRRIVVLAGMILACLIIAGPGRIAAKESKAELKQRLDSDNKDITAKLFEKSKDAKELYNKSYGYATFTATKVTFGASGGGGRGVAIEKKSGKRTYMKMATGGVGLGIGAQRTEYVFLFENKEVFDKFVQKGWQAGASASAAAGTEGANKAVGFKDGIAVFQFTKAGLVASADVSGTKYWKDDQLN